MVKAALEGKRLKGKQTMHEKQERKAMQTVPKRLRTEKSHALKAEYVLLFGFGGSTPHETCRSEI